MAVTRLALRQMLKGTSSKGSRGHSSPGAEDEVPLSCVATGQITAVALTDTDDLLRFEEKDETPKGTIAIFRSNGKTVNVCPYVDVSIEPTTQSTSAFLEHEALVIPASTDTQRHFVHLRVCDTVVFPNCKISLVVQDAQARSVDGHVLDVQVRSSNAEEDQLRDQLEDEQTDDEDDLNLKRSATPRALSDFPPAVDETPQRSTTGDNGNVFSTAPLNQHHDLPSRDDAAQDDSEDSANNPASASTPPNPDLSSTALDENSAASEAAERSLGASKRSLPDNDRADDPTPVKRTKKTKAPKTIVYKAAHKTPRHSTEVRSSPRVEIPPASATSTASSTTPTKVLLSSSKHADGQKAKLWLNAHNITIISDIPSRKTDFICVVGEGELPKTAKVLRSLALGRTIVTDDWITESMKGFQVLPAVDYIHKDLVDAADVDRSKLFADRVLFITRALQKQYGVEGFASIRALATEAGATRIETGSSSQGLDKKYGTAIFMGCESKDEDARQLIEGGKDVYKKDLLSQSIIRGELLLEADEFKIDAVAPKAGTKKGKKK